MLSLLKYLQLSLLSNPINQPLRWVAGHAKCIRTPSCVARVTLNTVPGPIPVRVHHVLLQLLSVLVLVQQTAPTTLQSSVSADGASEKAALEENVCVQP